MTDVTSVEVTYQGRCEDYHDKLCGKVWVKEFDPPVSKVNAWHIFSRDITIPFLYNFLGKGHQRISTAFGSEL